MNNIKVVTSNHAKFDEINAFLSHNGIHSTFFKIPAILNNNSLEEDNSAKLEYVKKSKNLTQSHTFLFESHDLTKSILSVYKEGKVFDFVGSNIKISLSEYITRFHRYKLESLTVRGDFNYLDNFLVEKLTINTFYPCHQWIKNYELFNLLNRRLYDNLINFALNERGMFPKVWSLNISKNYWNSPLNGGLPIIRKHDEVHEATYLLHDIFHFVFKDPIFTGHENEIEKTSYVCYRMMSEAFSLVLADMVSICFSSIESKKKYDITKRKIFPLFKSLKVNIEEIGDLFNILHSISYYCLFGNDKFLRVKCKDLNSLHSFENKYEIFFSVDFEWNRQNIENYLKQSNIIDFFNFLPKEINEWNTKTLAESITIDDNRISFSKIFSIFIKQLLEMFHYERPYNELDFIKKATLKYLSGQGFIFFKHEIASTEFFIKKYKELLHEIPNLESCDNIKSNFNLCLSILGDYLKILVEKGSLLPHEVINYKLHVPLFPPIFVSYDKPKKEYNSLIKVSNKILQHSLVSDSGFPQSLKQTISLKHSLQYKKIVKEKGKIIVICGPFGVGKDTIIKYLTELTDYIKFPAYTTRPIRIGERNGIDYRFVDNRTFVKIKSEFELLDELTITGHHYGTPIIDFQNVINTGQLAIVHLAISSAILLRAKIENVRIIYIAPPSKEELLTRLKKRGMTDHEIIIRLQDEPTNYDLINECDFKVINQTDQQESTAKTIIQWLNSL